MSIKKYILSRNADQNNNILLDFINFMDIFFGGIIGVCSESLSLQYIYVYEMILLFGHVNVRLSANAFWSYLWFIPFIGQL